MPKHFRLDPTITPGAEHQALVDASYTGSINDMTYAFLVAQGYTGSITDMLKEHNGSGLSPITAVLNPATSALVVGEALEDTTNWSTFLLSSNYASDGETISSVTVNYIGDTANATEVFADGESNHFSITVVDSAANEHTFNTVARTVLYAAPTATGALVDQSFAENSGDQTYATAGDFTGDGLTYTVNSVTGVTINSSTGVVTFDTDVMSQQTGTSITVTATNSGGSDTSGFSVDITDAVLTNFSITENTGATPDAVTVTSSEAGPIRYAVYADGTDINSLVAADVYAGTGALADGLVGTLTEGGGDLTDVSIEPTGLTGGTDYLLVLVQDIDTSGTYSNLVGDTFNENIPVSADVLTYMSEQDVPSVLTTTPTSSIDVSGYAAGDLLIIACGGGLSSADPSGVTVNGNAATEVEKWNFASAARGGIYSYTLQAADVTAGTIDVVATVSSTSAGRATAFDFAIAEGGGTVVDSASAVNANTQTMSVTPTSATNSIFHFVHGAPSRFSGTGVTYTAGVTAKEAQTSGSHVGCAAGLWHASPVSANTITFTIDGSGNYVAAAVVVE